MTALKLVGAARTFPGQPPVEALKPSDLSVAEGELVTITGPSGSGKSTLFNVAGLLDRPTQGEVWVSGQNTSELNEHQRTAMRGEELGFVFQAFHLMRQRTVLENVELTGLYQGKSEEERRKQAMKAIEQVGLEHRTNAKAALLSGGESQRVAIARAVAGTPQLLLCDEPTGNLDSKNSEGIISLLSELNQTGITVMIITHDPVVAAVGRVQLSMSDGELFRVK